MVTKTKMKPEDWESLGQELDVSRIEGFKHNLSEKETVYWLSSITARKVSLRSMDTQHKFNAMRICWNSLVPSYARLSSGPVRVLNTRKHPKKYQKEMLWRFGKLLGEADDLTLDQRADYNRMLSFMEKETIYNIVKLPDA